MREKGIEQAARARWQTEDSASSNGSNGSIPTVFVWRFACHRVAACPLCLAQPPSLAPCPPPLPSPCLTLTRQIALLSPSMLVLFIAFLTLFWLICFRCRFFLFAALLRRPSSPFVLASISVHWWPTTPPQLVVSPSPLQHSLHQARLAIGKFHFCVLQFNVRLMNSTPFEMHRFCVGPESFYPSFHSPPTPFIPHSSQLNERRVRNFVAFA